LEIIINREEDDNMVIQNNQWIDEVWNKIEKKINYTTDDIGIAFPHLSRDGKYDDMNKSDIYWWTNGFWPGIMWLMYVGTKNEKYKTKAETLEKEIDKALYGYTGLHHDVGFMWLTSSVANYRLTGNEQSKVRGQIAASILASRYNIKGKYIRAWNKDTWNEENKGWAIIDCMMNIPLLYWAAEVEKDDRFKYIAMQHADTVMKNFIRPDGSSNHIVEFNPETGEYVDTFGGQGYEAGSSWSRGQAWAIYGFVLSYIHTQKQEYLDTAKRVANYFISCIAEDYVPDCDFRSPIEPLIKDTTAGAIAACGLIEIAKSVKEYEKKTYLKAAMNILKALEKNYCNWTTEEQAILTMGTVAYHNLEGRNIPIIYGDYYFIEAILKLKGNDILFW
jgi:unsaturated chondroitin disaccharide hydrolase